MLWLFIPVERRKNMGAKQALIKQLARFENTKIVPVPKDRRPTAESIEKMGIGLQSYLEANDAMRTQSMSNASSHFTS